MTNPIGTLEPWPVGVTADDLTAALASYITAAAVAAGYQPLDSDLTAVAALTTTSFGRALLELVDAAALRTAAGLGTLATQSGTFSGTSSGTNTGDQDLSSYATTAAVAAGYQPVDSDLTAIAALTTTTFGRSLLTAADAAATRTLLGLGTAAVTDTGTGSGNTILGNDSRLTDTRTPTDATVSAAKLTTNVASALWRTVEVHPWLNLTSSTTGSWTAAVGTSLDGYVIQNTGGPASGDERTWSNVPLHTGTYTLRVLCTKASSFGILTVKVNGSTVGTIDTYNSTTTVNNIGEITGISVTGDHQSVQIISNTQNVASVGFGQRYSTLRFFRTA